MSICRPGTLNGPHQATLIQANGQLADAAQFNKQIIAYRNGAPVRIQDIGRAIDSVQNNLGRKLVQRANAPSYWPSEAPAGFQHDQRGGSRSRISFRAFVVKLPSSLSLEVLYDRSQSIRASVADVQSTLLIAAFLVVAVIFLFLRTASATIIPSLALPIAVIGTFGGMAFLGYSLERTFRFSR